MMHLDFWLKTLLVLIAAPIVGAVVQGLDRKITARIQRRVGPPVLQPIWDLVKLFRKEPIVTNQVQIVYAYMHLAFMALALLLVLMGQDSLMVLFILAFSTLSLILGGMSVRSPYSRIGSQREIMLMVAYEPILVLMVVGIYLVNGSFQFSAIAQGTRPLLFSMPLVFVAFLVVLALKLQKSPFDVATSHHAHQELVKGMTIEYAGPYLGVIELAHCLEVTLLLVLAGMFWATDLRMACALAAGSYFFAIVLDNAVARLTTMQVFRFMWTVVFGAAMTNIIWLYLRGMP